MVSEPFKGTINVDISDSVPDWSSRTAGHPVAHRGSLLTYPFLPADRA